MNTQLNLLIRKNRNSDIPEETLSMIKQYIIYLFPPKFGNPRTLQLSIIIIASRPISFLRSTVFKITSHSWPPPPSSRHGVYKRGLHATCCTTCVNSDFGKKKSRYTRAKSFCAPSHCALFALPISGPTVLLFGAGERIYYTNATPTRQTQAPRD